MGRDSGLIALRSGIGVGAEAIMIPEANMNADDILHKLEHSRKDTWQNSFSALRKKVSLAWPPGSEPD